MATLILTPRWLCPSIKAGISKGGAKCTISGSSLTVVFTEHNTTLSHFFENKKDLDAELLALS